MKTLTLLAFAFVFSMASAQDLIIHYDFIKDSYRYEINGKTVTKPTVKKNHEVKVMVENLNPFVFIARCQWEEQTVTENSSVSGIAGMFSGLGAGTDLLSGLMGGVDLSSIDMFTTRADISMFTTYAQARVELENAYRAYNRLSAVEQTIIRSESTAAKLKKLKYNPYIPADTLKNIADQMVINALNPEGAKGFAITSTTFLNKSTTLSNDLVEQYNQLMASADNFLSAYSAFGDANGYTFSEVGLDRNVKNMISTARKLQEMYSAEDINNNVEMLESQYNAIHYTPFVYTCNHRATGDQLTLTLDFFETSPYTRSQDFYMGGGDDVDTLRKIRTKSMNMVVQGDVKITTSVGLGFPTYFNKNQTYSNRDSIITGTTGNNFAPCISTFLNFYPYSGQNVHFGGTFGVGIPVQNEGTSSLNFFLGGSAILGSTSKVALNAGLAIGQLPFLTGGKKTGDNIGDDYTEPETKKSFTTGAFFGISFAISQ